VVEKNDSFGRETSSRNSEVIHSGIYYPLNSLKAELCVRGNALLYDYLIKRNISHSKIGKIVVAVNEDEKRSLFNLKTNGERNGVKDLSILVENELRALEPDIKGVAGLLIPSTGILDTHSFMQSLVADVKNNGASIAYNSNVCAISKAAGVGYIVKIENENYEFETGILINCGGLWSDKLASMCGIDIVKESYKLHYCKGDYFRTSKQLNIKKLVYPVPEAEMHSLGIHLTPDLGGGLRFGPDATYVINLEYTVDETKKDKFAHSIGCYLPSITSTDIFADTSGIRPKLQGPKDKFRDFIIKEESSKGLKGLINLIGIESPGLTSCLAIAEHVQGLI
ncbi:MAG: hypothetical protein A3J81_09065, partial [Nitrospirae bacterium RIFOXYB2_FULL_43_5]